MAAAVGLIALLAWQFPEALKTEQDWLHLVYLIGLLALVSSGAISRRRNRLGQSAKQAAVWLAIALVCIAGYGYRYEAQAVGQRVLGELVPGYAANTGEAAVTLRAGPNGHYRVQAVVAPARALLYSVLPYQVYRVDVVEMGSSDPREIVVKLGVVPSEGQAGAHVFHVTITDPQGCVRDEYTQNVKVDPTEPSTSVVRRRMALSDPAGSWTITARDVATGHVGHVRFALNATN